MGAEEERIERTDFGFPPTARITASEEIRTLFRRGKRRRTRHLDVFVSPSPSAFPRLGIVVPKHKQTIVRRNRLKRRLRELGRTILLPRLREAERPLDVLIRVRPEAYSASFDDLRGQVRELVEGLCSRAL